MELAQAGRRQTDSTDTHGVGQCLESSLPGVSRLASLAVALIDRVTHSRYNP